MPQLLIVRHAIAEERDEAAQLGHSDAERPLTKKGIKKMQAIAAGIARLVPPPIRIVSSPLRRAQQTAELLITAFPDTPLTIEQRLAPGGTLKQLINQLNQQFGKSEGTIILVGHEPDLSSLISLLLFGEASAAIQLKKGGAALLDFPGHIDSGQAILLWLQTPRQLSCNQ